MLELLLLRHAKSAWDDPGLADRERPLNGRGRRAAALMGRFLSEAGLLPDRALLSAAARTRETFKRLRKEWTGPPPPAETLEDLYLAPPSAILACIRRHGGEARRLLVLGHNPGLERLGVRLAAAGSDEAALAALAEKFPTGGLAWFQFAADRWTDIGEGRLLRFVVPRDLEPAAGGD